MSSRVNMATTLSNWSAATATILSSAKSCASRKSPSPKSTWLPLSWNSIRNQLVAGSIPFGVAVGKYSDDEQAKSSAGQIMTKSGSTFLAITDLDKDMVLLLKNANLKPGEYSKPTVFTDERGKKGVRIVYMVSKSEPHRENLRDDYNNVAQRALDGKRSAALEKWFLQKIPTMYVNIADEYRNCSSLTKWEGQPVTAGN